jgi:hypothetical protein
MAVAYSTLHRNARLDALTAAVGAAGKLALYDGARPATGGAVTTKLAEFVMGSPFAPAAASGALSPTLPSNVTGIATGTATWARLTTSGGTFIADLTVGVGSGEVQLAGTAVITSGQPVAMSAATITEGNP